MRKLKVDPGELEMALDNSFPEHRYFLDLETGKVILVTDETGRELEEIYAELTEDVEDAQIVEAIRQPTLQDWQKEELLQADQVERGYHTRYIRIESPDPHADYRAMEDFTPALHRTQCGASVSTVKDALTRSVGARD